MYKRDDWTLFRTLGTLISQAGVPLGMLRRLVVKELVDNALDEAGAAGVSETSDGIYEVFDLGPGIAGTPDDIANLFSIRRPLTSSKLLRLPTRGAMGNGLRVVAGAVLASGGELRVWTGNKVMSLCPRDDGGTDVQTEVAARSWKGTRVEVRLGDSIPADPDAMAWGQAAIGAADGGNEYKGKTSGWWYDADTFFELCQSAGTLTVRDLVETMDGCTGTKAGKVAAGFSGRRADDVDREQAAEILKRVRESSREVKPSRLGCIGERKGWGPRGKEEGVLEIKSGRGGMGARIPYVVEAWATVAQEDSIEVMVNRTPITGEVEIFKGNETAKRIISGSGLNHFVKTGRRPLAVIVNITTPYMPVISGGKSPDLEPFVQAVGRAIRTAARRANFAAGKGSGKVTTKSIIEMNIQQAAAMASGDGKYRFSQRQLFYAMRPLAQAAGVEVAWKWFCQVLTDYEEALGKDLPGIYRDSRGTLYHPHGKGEMSLGTLAVESYERPEWTFNKVLYSEKEGLFPILRQERWPERNDCALLTSKGFASRAASDLLNLMGDTQEEITFFCIHDADAYGTSIFQALQNSAESRGNGTVHVVNLGLEPDEALAMGLSPERVESKRETHGVADYVTDPKWRKWLQTNRIELNAMTTPQLLEWLDRKLAPWHNGKIVPPVPVLSDTLTNDVRNLFRAELTEKALREARVDERVIAEMEAAAGRLAAASVNLDIQVMAGLHRDPVKLWTGPVAELAERVVKEPTPKRRKPKK